MAVVVKRFHFNDFPQKKTIPIKIPESGVCGLSRLKRMLFVKKKKKKGKFLQLEYVFFFNFL